MIAKSTIAVKMNDPFQSDNDTNSPPFPSPRQGWEEDPIATYYLRALNREIRALKSDYDLACSCHTYIKMAVLSLRLYLHEWEGLMGEVMGCSDSETEGKLVGSEGVGYEGLKGLDGYREVLELMDMRTYFTFPIYLLPYLLVPFRTGGMTLVKN